MQKGVFCLLWGDCKKMIIGITMRVTENESYSEERDALSKDWYRYIAKILPRAVLVPLLNQPERVIKTVEALKIRGIILSSGGDWGTVPDRDKTEKNLIDYCFKRQIPILGVCRGMQVLNVVLGGRVEEDILLETKEKHIRVKHRVIVSQKPFKEWLNTDKVLINSFHKQGIVLRRVAKQFMVFMQTASGVVEGIYHRNKPIIGIQWHPERNNPGASFDRRLIKTLFNRGIFWK